MKSISTLPLCQGGKNHDKIRTDLSYVILEKVEHNAIQENMHNLEALSVAKAKEYLKKMLLPQKEAVQVFSNLEEAKKAVKIFNERKYKEELPANITEAPKFYEAKSESVELSQSAKETFARIGERAREAFIEEQIERAILYNIPYKSYGENYYGLMMDIDKYEYLLGQAKDYCVDWDTCEYDLAALEQLIEEAEHNAYMADQDLRSYFSATRGVEV